MNLTILLGLAGGLGLFLFGMTLMSEGIEKAVVDYAAEVAAAAKI